MTLYKQTSLLIESLKAPGEVLDLKETPIPFTYGLMSYTYYIQALDISPIGGIYIYVDGTSYPVQFGEKYLLDAIYNHLSQVQTKYIGAVVAPSQLANVLLCQSLNHAI